MIPACFPARFLPSLPCWLDYHSGACHQEAPSGGASRGGRHPGPSALEPTQSTACPRTDSSVAWALAACRECDHLCANAPLPPHPWVREHNTCLAPAAGNPCYTTDWAHLPRFPLYVFPQLAGLEAVPVFGSPPSVTSQGHTLWSQVLILTSEGTRRGSSVSHTLAKEFGELYSKTCFQRLFFFK